MALLRLPLPAAAPPGTTAPSTPSRSTAWCYCAFHSPQKHRMVLLRLQLQAEAPPGTTAPSTPRRSTVWYYCDLLLLAYCYSHSSSPSSKQKHRMVLLRQLPAAAPHGPTAASSPNANPSQTQIHSKRESPPAQNPLHAQIHSMRKFSPNASSPHTQSLSKRKSSTYAKPLQTQILPSANPLHAQIHLMRKSTPCACANPLHAQILSIRKEIVISLLYPPTRMRLLLDARIATLMEPIPLSLSIKMLPTRRTSICTSCCRTGRTWYHWSSVVLMNG